MSAADFADESWADAATTDLVVPGDANGGLVSAAPASDDALSGFRVDAEVDLDAAPKPRRDFAIPAGATFRSLFVAQDEIVHEAESRPTQSQQPSRTVAPNGVRR